MKHDDHVDPAVAAQRAVAGLARSVEALTRDVQALEGGMRHTASAAAVSRTEDEVSRLARVVTDLGQLLTQDPRSGAQPAAEAVPVRSWLMVAEDQSAVEQVLSELLPWMQSVYLRYDDARDTLPACWLWHPAIAEELLWLMDAWTAAYQGPEASLKLVGDWHDRQRPGVTRRAASYAPGCDALAHRDTAGQPAVTVPLAVDADPFVVWWATDRDVHGPAPTPEQIKAGRRGGLAAVADTTGARR